MKKMDVNTQSNSGLTPGPTPVSPPAENNDISKTTITVLVLLTLMISVIGTWTVLNELSNVKPVQQSSAATGKVELTILPNGNANAIANSPQQTSAATGQVALEIKK